MGGSQNKFRLTDKQQHIVNEAVNWYHNSSEQIFQFAGNPGTGKSVVMNAIIDAIGIDRERVAPMSYVGAAAINMRLKGLYNAKTIHSWIYEIIERPILDANGEVVMNKYFNRPEVTYMRIPRELPNIDLMAIDEGGTVPLKMRKDILSRGKKVLVAGDLDQLPPVGDYPAFLADGNVHVLDEIMRQFKGSAIVYLCQRAKHGLPIHTGVYGNEVIVIEEKDFEKVADKMLPAAGVILCGKNETRQRYTDHIRHNILGKTSKLPDCGEKLICRMNDWRLEIGGINLTNGLTGRVLNQPDVSTFDGKCFRMDFLPDLNPIPFMDIPVDYEYFTTNVDRRKDMKNFNLIKSFDLLKSLNSPNNISLPSSRILPISYSIFVEKDNLATATFFPFIDSVNTCTSLSAIILSTSEYGTGGNNETPLSISNRCF